MNRAIVSKVSQTIGRETRRCRRSASTLKILVVDGYQQKSRDEFEKVGLPFAADLYKKMLENQAPAGWALDFHTIYPCAAGFDVPEGDFLSNFDGACFTGSSMSAYSEEEDCTRQVEIMRRLFQNDVSCFGSCWGIQIAAVALDGKVELNPKGREVGVGRKIMLTVEGQKHPMFDGKKTVFEAFMSHSDEVTRVPTGATITAGNDHSSVQAMSVPHGSTESWFVQYHPEYDLRYFAGLIATRKERMTSMGFFKNAADIDTYVAELYSLHDDQDLKHIRWKYGIDEDMLDDDIKQREVRNWLRFISKTPTSASS
eukprot:g2128.t1